MKRKKKKNEENSFIPIRLLLAEKVVSIQNPEALTTQTSAAIGLRRHVSQ